MAWQQLSITTPHIAYAVAGFGLILFSSALMYVSHFTYIGEPLLGTIYGIIVGPHCIGWFDPTDWGDSDKITTEISRFVLVLQLALLGAELPAKYALKNAYGLLLLLFPVMTFGWLLSSVFIWKLVPTLAWIEALCIAACVTATDPVLCSAIVGSGKFAELVPGHIRKSILAESGANDGLAFPFVYLALTILRYQHHPGDIAKHYILEKVLYECGVGILIGAVFGYGLSFVLKWSRRIVEPETYLVFLVVQFVAFALLAAGVGTLTGTDELLVAFSMGCGLSWSGWFHESTEHTHFSGQLDILLNTGYFLYFGAIIPWQEFNNAALGLKAWKLVCLAILVLVFRRIPIALALKPIAPDLQTWKQALVWGHLGPLGVGGLFVALIAKEEMQSIADSVPYSAHYFAINTIWPIVCFLALSCIIVHGLSATVYAGVLWALGQRERIVSDDACESVNSADKFEP